MKAYRFFAYFIAVQVVIQAAAIAFALAGIGYWVNEDGGVLNKAVLEESEKLDFVGVIGFPIHFMNGMLVAVVALVLLIISFFAKVPDGTKFASIILLLVIVQIALGLGSHSSPYLAPLHAMNAFGILAMAWTAAKRAGSAAPADTAATVA